MTSTLPNPLPIILCGKTEQIGRRVAEILRPEYEVIHFTLGIEAAAAEIKHVLAGRDPDTQSKNSVGTSDYSKPPRAVG
ncbi:hypothetical protein SLS62_003759 [Diatrype stigma]|uniref:Uncharacterized protein n=1 Tax=Diatrype stigma TaxID=117547 RepID=A0AAN9UVR3_9PEZI